MLLVVEVALIVAMLAWRRNLVTPVFFAYVAFVTVYTVLYDPLDRQFTASMEKFSDVLKFLVATEAFVLLSRHLDSTDKTLSLAIGILAAALITSAVWHLSLHARVLTWLAGFWAASLWWAWRRSDPLDGWLWRHAVLLAAYLTRLAVIVTVHEEHWIRTMGQWKAVERCSEVASAGLFILWMYSGPQFLKQRKQVGASEVAGKHNYPDDHVTHQVSFHP